MRKAQKKQAEDFVALLGQTHDEIRKAVKQNHISTALSLLADCQEGAISLGNLVEKTEGEDAPLIPLLEEYCERLYRIYEKLSGENQTEENKIGTNQVGANQAGGISVNADKIQKQLRQLFIRMKNGIRDIKVRREAVFLPYKASMWDSLESVWKTAEEDPDCDAYVIPIPYYDRKPGGSFGELHYEGSQYPEYVPVTWYEDYDFESRKPDMIFIHNPYDDCNLVTSVLPFFYSSNLKQFTEQLIYIPYFVLEEIDPDNGPAVENMKHFCLSPGVYNADKVIVQSENMRQVYIKVMTEATGKETRAYWEQKILGLGSPKFDKVLSTRKEDLKIPEDWLRIIRKPDGSWKKIIFYNTSVGALLQHSEQYLEKMRDVFHVFYENRNEVALLWRPHPLIKATIESMRPQLWAGYREIVERYQEEGWGIYDDSADMDRAVALSDGYYGDMSSVVWVYQNTGKPVMEQNVYIVTNKETDLNCVDIARYSDYLFILTRDTQVLYKYSLTEKRFSLCGKVGNKTGQMFISMALCGNKLYIAPYVADNICIYDIKGEEFKRIALKHIQGKAIYKYYKICFSYLDKVYLLSSENFAMLCVDTNSDSIREIPEWLNEFKDRYGYDTGVATHANVCIVDCCFWVALKGDNIILQYNLCTEEYHFWHVGEKGTQYVTVNYDGTYFWLSGNERFIVRWKKESNEIRKFNHFPKGFENGIKEIGCKELFSHGYLWNSSIYFAPMNSNMLVKFFLESGEMESIASINVSSICPKMVKIDGWGIYVEEVDQHMRRERSYLIGIDGECMTNSIKLKEDDDIDAIKRDVKTGIIKEAHPLYLPVFFGLMDGADERSVDIEEGNMGKGIFKDLLKDSAAK